MDSLIISWNKAVRKIFKLPYQCHTRFLHLITKTSHPRTQIFTRFLKFASSCLNSTNNLVRAVSSLCVGNNTTFFGSNLDSILNMVNISCSNFVNGSKTFSIKRSQAALDNFFSPQNEDWRVHFILDLLDILHGDASVDLNNDEVYDMLNYITCFWYFLLFNVFLFRLNFFCSRFLFSTYVVVLVLVRCE